ncbi:TPA: hypothetical protein U2M54_003388, partial [Providencia rettgeri]|nr:hypothetical protein [Providencia rettgeri]
SSTNSLNIIYRDKEEKNVAVTSIPKKTGTAMLIGDYGFGSRAPSIIKDAELKAVLPTQVIRQGGGAEDNSFNTWGNGFNVNYASDRSNGIFFSSGTGKVSNYTVFNGALTKYDIYNTANTTKDANGNLKAASPIVKLFSDDVELNEESEGVEMEHLGVGHYLIKGVVGFNADGAWGINNGFVIPQDHNGKNMVLIDYEVRPDGDIEVFVFHQQNADMPERFQNKRIKLFDEEGAPVYFENYEPCDVPESRWIDMRVEMPPNSTYNQKQAEAERLAKIEAERLAQEEAKRAAEEAERVEQEAAERKQYGLGDNSVLL